MNGPTCMYESDQATDNDTMMTSACSCCV